MPVQMRFDPFSNTLTLRSSGHIDTAARLDAEQHMTALITTHRPRFFLMDYRDLSEHNSVQEQSAAFDRGRRSFEDDPTLRERYACIERLAVIRSPFFPETHRLAAFFTSLGVPAREFMSFLEARNWLYGSDEAHSQNAAL